MKKKSIIHFTLSMALILSLVTSCDQNQDDLVPQPYFLNVFADGITDLTYESNIQADYGYFGGAFSNFDISIHNYNPQSFSIGFILPADFAQSLEEGETYPIGAYTPIGPDGLPNETLIFTAHINLLNENIDTYQWYDTNLLGGGKIKFIEITDDYMVIEFDFLAYYFANLLEDPISASVAGNIKVLPRENFSGEAGN